MLSFLVTCDVWNPFFPGINVIPVLVTPSAMLYFVHQNSHLYYYSGYLLVFSIHQLGLCFEFRALRHDFQGISRTLSFFVFYWGHLKFILFERKRKFKKLLKPKKDIN